MVTGTVPDTRPYINSASCAIVPIRIGGGTRIKIYELMSMEKSVVSTTVGAEGLDYSDGENILIADEDWVFAEKMIHALKDKEYRTAIGRKAREYVVAYCSWKAVSTRFVDLLTQAKDAESS